MTSLPPLSVTSRELTLSLFIRYLSLPSHPPLLRISSPPISASPPLPSSLPTPFPSLPRYASSLPMISFYSLLFSSSPFGRSTLEITSSCPLPVRDVYSLFPRLGIALVMMKNSRMKSVWNFNKGNCLYSSSPFSFLALFPCLYRSLSPLSAPLSFCLSVPSHCEK